MSGARGGPEAESGTPDRAGAVLTRRSWVVVLAVATAMGLAESLKAVYMMRLQGASWPLSQAFLGNLPWWYAWAALTPAIFWLASRIRLDDDRRRARAVGLHAVASILVAALHIGVVGSLYYHTIIVPNRSAGVFREASALADVLRQWAGAFGIFEVMTYWALVATYYTIDLYRRHQQSSVLTARLQARASGLQLRAVEAQVRALRMELNPHFLYNTLNSVGAFVRTDQNAAALQMLARLGDLLRGTLDRDLGPETPLGNELELLQRYLDIELVRFSDRLAIEVDVPDEIRGAMVPSFMLQPLVENAIRHGIGGRSGLGTIRITGRRHAESLALAVQDDGIGLGDVSGAGDGIGLSNTRARLEQLYGDAGRLVLRDAASGGAIAEVTLPFRRDEERNRSNGSDTQR